MSLPATRIDFLTAVARANCAAGKVDSPQAKLWQVVTGCSGQGCAVGLDRCWSKKSDGKKESFNGFKPTFHEEQLWALSRTHGNYVIGVGWHGEIACQLPEDIVKIFVEMFHTMYAHGFEHQYWLLSKDWQTVYKAILTDQFLMKRLTDYLSDTYLWTGTTVNLPSELERIGHLAQIPGRHFVMFEPLMGEWDNVETKIILQEYFVEARVEQVVIGGWSRVPSKDIPPLWPVVKNSKLNLPKPYELEKYRMDGHSVRAITEIARKCGAKVFYKHNLPQSVDPKDAFNLGLNLRKMKEIALATPVEPTQRAGSASVQPEPEAPRKKKR